MRKKAMNGESIKVGNKVWNAEQLGKLGDKAIDAAKGNGLKLRKK